MYYRERMRISDFEWDDGSVLHLGLGHGIEPEEAEEVFRGLARVITGWDMNAAERRYCQRQREV